MNSGNSVLNCLEYNQIDTNKYTKGRRLGHALLPVASKITGLWIMALKNLFYFLSLHRWIDSKTVYNT